MRGPRESASAVSLAGEAGGSVPYGVLQRFLLIGLAARHRGGGRRSRQVELTEATIRGGAATEAKETRGEARQTGRETELAAVAANECAHVYAARGHAELRTSHVHQLSGVRDGVAQLRWSCE